MVTQSNHSSYKYKYMDIIRIICALFLPPLGVFLQVGFGKHLWINLLLTFLGFLPGVIHAFWVIIKVR